MVNVPMRSVVVPIHRAVELFLKPRAKLFRAAPNAFACEMRPSLLVGADHRGEATSQRIHDANVRQQSDALLILFDVVGLALPVFPLLLSSLVGRSAVIASRHA
jgi:hypothetical protein